MGNQTMGPRTRAVLQAMVEGREPVFDVPPVAPDRLPCGAYDDDETSGRCGCGFGEAAHGRRVVDVVESL